MQDDFSDIYKPEKPKRGFGEHLSWQEVWTLVVTDGSVPAFDRILNDPKATASRAFLWIFLIATFSAVINSVLTVVQWNGMPAVAYPYTFNPSAVFLPMLLCSTLLAGALSILALVISGGIVHLIAKAFGGKGTFSEWLYIYGAIAAPFIIISIILGLTSIILPEAALAFSCVSLVIAIYQLILQGRGLMALHAFTGGQAAGTIAISIFIMVAMVFVIAFCILSSLMGSMMGEIFPQIMLTIQAGTPFP